MSPNITGITNTLRSVTVIHCRVLNMSCKLPTSLLFPILSKCQSKHLNTHHILKASLDWTRNSCGHVIFKILALFHGNVFNHNIMNFFRINLWSRTVMTIPQEFFLYSKSHTPQRILYATELAPVL